MSAAPALGSLYLFETPESTGVVLWGAARHLRELYPAQGALEYPASGFGCEDCMGMADMAHR